jgi:exodeoxyribonuclease V alpha subunit
MAVQNQEIVGVFAHENHRFENPDGDVIVGTLSDKRKVKGPLIPTEVLRSGLRYTFYGRETEHPQWGKQFHFNSYSPLQPYGEAETVAYLMQLDGVGPTTAKALWAKFGADSIDTLRDKPEECEGLGRAFKHGKAQEASRYLKSMQNTQHVRVSLMGLLNGKGFPKKTINRAIESAGTSAADVIRRNPYWLMQFPGCGFAHADALYVDLANQLPPEKRLARLSRIKRQALCLYYEIRNDSQGHTWFDGEKVVQSLYKNLSGAKINPRKAVRLALRARLLICRRDCGTCAGKKFDLDGLPCDECKGKGGKAFITDAQRSGAEYSVAKSVVQLLESTHPLDWPDPFALIQSTDAMYEFYHANQEREVAKAMSTRIGILSGSPGTGKSACAAKLVKRLIAENGAYSIGVCAPTGKAAQRVNELMLLSGIKSITATTIHRLLGVATTKDGGFTFVHDADNKLPYKFIIVDESSMLDVSLMSCLLAAIDDKSHLLLVGDPNQLSPVGHGCPLRDLIRSRTCGIGELTEIRRNSGQIVLACKQIRETHTFESSKTLNIKNGDNLVVSHCDTPEQQVESIVSLIRKISATGNYDPIWDCQVLVATNENSQVSRKPLNARLQELLNPNGESIAGNPFRVGDKVLNSKNNWYSVVSGELDNEDTNDKGQVFVANGEMGKILKVFRGYTLIQVAGRKVQIRAPHAQRDEDESGSGSDWSTGYAITAHKFQGSETPVGIVVIDSSAGASMVCSREWLFCAISRFKQACILVGKASVARSFCLRSSLNSRKTFLVERISESFENGVKNEQ